jgi:hypothetical protein
MKSRKILALAAAAAAFGIASVSNPAAAQAAKPTAGVPFSATINITEQLARDGTLCPLVGTISGTGIATQIGRVAVRSTDCVQPRGATFTFSSLQVVLTAPNGDQIFVNYLGTLNTATGAIQGTYTIVDGTGRFDHATGGGTMVGSEDISGFPNATGQLQLTGTIDY